MLLSRVEEELLDELERDSLEENVPDSVTSGPEGSGASGTNTDAHLRSRISLARATAEQKPAPGIFASFPCSYKGPQLT